VRVHSVKVLRRLGIVLLWDAWGLVALLVLVGLGAFEYRERLFIPVMVVCVIPLVAGYIIAIYHLSVRQKDPETRAKWWTRFLWAGPFAAGWYLSKLR
jgi:hypothetical protein